MEQDRKEITEKSVMQLMLEKKQRISAERKKNKSLNESKINPGVSSLSPISWRRV